MQRCLTPILSLIGLCIPFFSINAQYALLTPEEMMDLAEKASASLEQNGATALPEFNGPVRLTLTDQTFEKLAEENIDSEVLQKLEALKNKEYSGIEFTNAVDQLIGKRTAYKLEPLLFRYAKQEPSKWVKGRPLEFLYPVVLDCTNFTFAAQPWLPYVVNTPNILKQIRSPKGKLFLFDACQLVSKNPEGVWYEEWLPLDARVKRIFHLYTYIRQVPNQPYQVLVMSANLKESVDTLNDLARKRWKK